MSYALLLKKAARVPEALTPEEHARIEPADRKLILDGYQRYIDAIDIELGRRAKAKRTGKVPPLPTSNDPAMQDALDFVCGGPK